jgi:NADH-quinone oxidoreductase subunit C
MNEFLKPVAEAFQARFGAQLHEYQGDVTLILNADQIIAACEALRSEFGFDFLIDITAVDYWPQDSPRFHVIYHMQSMQHFQVLRLRVPVEGLDAHIPTVEKIWPSANWYEREVWDMFGIRIDGHSDLRRIIMPADWEGHPLRKDYPLGYEEVQFTFNFDEVNKRKPKPKI